MSGTDCDAISEVRVAHSGVCRNPVKPLQQLTLYLIKSKILDPGFSRSVEGDLCKYRPSMRQSFTLLGALSIR
jgi:hypothetical protein